MYSTRIVVDIIECLSDPCSAVRNAADSITDLVLEYDRNENGELGQLGLQIRKKRFESYNNQWLTHFDMLSGGIGHMGNGNHNDNGHSLGHSNYNMNSSYDESDNDNDYDYEGIAHGSMEWKMMMKQKERLALDMSDLDGMTGDGGNRNRMISGGMNDDVASSGDGEDFDESGADWGR